MKATILTFSKAHNRGAMMQCYALLKVLSGKGYDVEFLDIQMPKKRLSIKGKMYYWMNERRIGSFGKKHNFQYTQKYNSYEELAENPPKTDILVMGSDQIWNTAYTNRFDPRIYFGGFLHGVKKVAYAASFGLDTWTATPYDEDIKSAVQDMSAISVREDSGIKICKEVFGREDAVCIADPTLLLKRENLLELIGLPRKINTKGKTYVYLLHNNKEIDGITKAVVSKLKRPSCGNISKNALEYLLATATIPEWLANINGADYIVTNSFHCMVMCLLLHKEFYIVPTFPGREIRMTSLLDKLHIFNRYIDNCDFTLQPIIDYAFTDVQLNQLREDSMDFLNRVF